MRRRTALVTEPTRTGVAQLLTQAATPTRPALTPGNVSPGWNVGNPLRAGWEETRCRVREVAFTTGTARCCAVTSTDPPQGRATPTPAAR